MLDSPRRPRSARTSPRALRPGRRTGRRGRRGCHSGSAVALPAPQRSPAPPSCPQHRLCTGESWRPSSGCLLAAHPPGGPCTGHPAPRGPWLRSGRVPSAPSRCALWGKPRPKGRGPGKSLPPDRAARDQPGAVAGVPRGQQTPHHHARSRPARADLVRARRGISLVGVTSGARVGRGGGLFINFYFINPMTYAP